MLICNRCGTSIPDGARFCPTCGDPVTAGDLAKNQVVHRSERVGLVCPHCERQALYAIPAHGAGEVTCASCAQPFDTSVVRIRSKRSTGQKKKDTRSFSIRAESLDGREILLEFIRQGNADFELRARDLAAFSSIRGTLTIVQNLSVGRYMKLVGSGCMGMVLLWLGAITAAGAFVF